MYLLEIHKKVIYIHSHKIVMHVLQSRNKTLRAKKSSDKLIACLKKLIELSSVFGILKFARTFVQALFFPRTRSSST